jgi:WD40 repeat protein
MLVGKHSRIRVPHYPFDVSDVTAVWDVTTGQQLDRFQYTSPFSATCTPDGQLGVVDDQGALVLRDPTSGRNEATPVQLLSPFNVLIAFSPDSRLVAHSAPGRWRYGFNGPVHVADLATGVSQALRCEEQGIPVSLEFSADSRTLAVMSWEGILSLWDVPTGQQRARFRSDAVEQGPGHVYNCHLSPDLRRVFFDCTNLPGGLWNLSTPEQKMVLHAETAVGRAAFTPEGRAFGFRYEEEPAIWLYRCLGLNQQDRRVVICDLDAGERVVARLPSCMPGLLSPDCGMFAAISTHDTIQLWDVPPREPLEIILGLAAAAALLAGAGAWWCLSPSQADRRTAPEA